MDLLTALIGTQLPLAERRRWMHEPMLGPHAFRGAQLDWARRTRDRALELGQEFLLFDDPNYPEALKSLRDAPLLLYLKGNADLLRLGRRVAVVGSRRGTERGRRCAERLGMELGRAGVAVVSGLALGIDGESHRGALAVGGPCIGVVATGLDSCHPSAHRRLQEHVAREGLLVSEYPPGTSAQKYAFVARNRILAAVGEALVVVEAGARSGALGTVDFALQMGHNVMCYPGPVDCVASQGGLRMLREGAELVRHGQDVLESLGIDASALSPTNSLGLSSRPETAEGIARRLGRSFAEVLSELVELEGDGLVRREAGGRWSVTS